MVSLLYKFKNSPFHKCSPFIKILWLLTVVIVSILFEHPLILLTLFISSFLFAVLSKITKEWIGFLKLAVLFFPFIILFNVIVNGNGETILWQAPFTLPAFGRFNITLEEIMFALTMCIRLGAILGAFTVINLTTNPDDLMRAVTKLKFPYKSTMITTLTTKFVPILLRDFNDIVDVQRSRGVDFNNTKMKEKIINYAIIFFPLLSKSLERSFQLAESMESRAFGRFQKRTYFNEIKISPSEYMIMGIILLPLLMSAYMLTKGQGSFIFYQKIDPLIKSSSEIRDILILFLLEVIVIPVLLFKWRISYD